MIRKLPIVPMIILSALACGATSIAVGEEPAAKPADTAAMQPSSAAPSDTLDEIEIVARFLDTSNTSAMKLSVPVLEHAVFRFRLFRSILEVAGIHQPAG